MSNSRTAIDLLTAKGIDFKVIPHRRTFTAEDEAATLHVPAHEVLKVLVLDTGFKHAVAVIPASAKLDMTLVRDALSDTQAQLATESETAAVFPSFELGAIPPLPSMSKVPVYVDPEVMLDPEVIFAVDHEESVRVKTEDLYSGEYVTVTPLVRRVPTAV